MSKRRIGDANQADAICVPVAGRCGARVSVGGSDGERFENVVGSGPFAGSGPEA